MSSRSTRLRDHFVDLTDPRRRKVVYPLINVVTTAICAVIAGADDLPGRERRKGSKRIGIAISDTVRGGKPTDDVRYYILSKRMRPGHSGPPCVATGASRTDCTGNAT